MNTRVYSFDTNRTHVNKEREGELHSIDDSTEINNAENFRRFFLNFCGRKHTRALLITQVPNHIAKIVHVRKIVIRTKQIASHDCVSLFQCRKRVQL